MSNVDFAAEASKLESRWAKDPRWNGVERTYTAEDVVRLRGSVKVEFSLAKRGAAKLWELLHSKEYVHTFGALTGAQAVQMVKAGLQAIYMSGWQVAADGNLCRADVPGSEHLSVEQRARARAAHQQRADAGGPDRVE